MIRAALTILTLIMLVPPAQGEQIRVRLLVSNPKPLVGQPIRLTLEVERPLRGAGPLRPRWPRAPGTILVDEPPGRSVRLDNERGIDLLHRVIRPLYPGQLMLDRAGVVAGARIITAAPRSLIVQSLPESGRPVGFSGLVGHLDAVLSPFDSNGLLTLTLSGDADLHLADTPVICADGRVPVAVRDRLKGHWPGWTRDIKLLAQSGCRPRLQLTWYDPDTGRYQLPATDGAGCATVLAFAVLAGLFLLAYGALNTYQVRRCRHILDQLLSGLPHHQRLQRLARAGTPAALLAQVDSHWRRFDDLSPDGRLQPAAAPGSSLPWRICRQLAVTIDKARLLQP